ncbi:MAG: MFS transporter [candidate division WOR-3 bacterium]|nr:MFS transporter [candidate division WOR-3 bacterium]
MLNLLKKRGILFLAFSNGVSQLGDRLTHMVIITLIGVKYPGKISAFSEFAVTFTLPVLILAPFVGVIVDHWNKQMIMFRCHLIQSILIFLTPSFVILFDSLVPIWILVFTFFALDVFNNTAKNAVVPDLVEYHELVPANSFIVTVARIATFLGMVGGGYLIKWVGWRLGFYLDGTTHLIAGFLVLGMGAKVLFEPSVKIDISLQKRLKESFKYFLLDIKELVYLLFHDRVVLFVMISVFVLPFAAAIAYTVLIYLIQQVFNMGTTGVGWLGGVIGTGMLAGGLLMGFLGKRFNRPLIIICSMVMLALFFIIGPFFINPLSMYAIAFISGMVFSFVGIAQDTILQEDVLKSMRGRIFATKEFVISLTFMVCAVGIGLISSSLRPFVILRLAGLIIILLTLLAVFVLHSIPPETKKKL